MSAAALAGLPTLEHPTPVQIQAEDAHPDPEPA
jgi:hypothetical protein